MITHHSMDRVLLNKLPGVQRLDGVAPEYRFDLSESLRELLLAGAPVITALVMTKSGQSEVADRACDRSTMFPRNLPKSLLCDDASETIARQRCAFLRAPPSARSKPFGRHASKRSCAQNRPSALSSACSAVMSA